MTKDQRGQNSSRDLTKVLNKSHENKWVALSSDYKKVLGSSENLIELTKAITDKSAVYLKVPPSDAVYAF
jgi:hypothetical protein